MKLQAASKKELTRISVGTIVCSAAMIGILYLLSLVGVGTFSLSRILLGAVIGSAVAIGNFALLCITVQQAVGIEDQKHMKAKFQLSYNFRMLIQAAWAVIALVVPQIHVVAGALPLLFPHAVILFLRFTGKLFPKEEASAEAPAKEDSSGSEAV